MKVFCSKAKVLFLLMDIWKLHFNRLKGRNREIEKERNREGKKKRKKERKKEKKKKRRK
jgi:hypothetical protein